MNVIELLEATKVEVDKRWERHVGLWDSSVPAEESAACLLGCIGFARWGNNWPYDFQDSGYGRLRKDDVTAPVIEALAKGARVSEMGALEKVYRQNDTHFISKWDAKDFVELALADLKSS